MVSKPPALGFWLSFFITGSNKGSVGCLVIYLPIAHTLFEAEKETRNIAHYLFLILLFILIVLAGCFYWMAHV
jgi:hypothetical protein